jgi:hypothetical protein
MHPKSIDIASVLNRPVSITETWTPPLRIVTSGDPWKGEVDYVIADQYR